MNAGSESFREWNRQFWEVMESDLTGAERLRRLQAIGDAHRKRTYAAIVEIEQEAAEIRARAMGIPSPREELEQARRRADQFAAELLARDIPIPPRGD